MQRHLDPTGCQETIYGERGFFHQCQNKPKVTRDGKLYCRIHDPEYITEKRQKDQAKWDKEWAEKRQRWALEDERERATEGLTLDELRQVTPGMIRTLLTRKKS